jgi:hypothetical protein
LNRSIEQRRLYAAVFFDPRESPMDTLTPCVDKQDTRVSDEGGERERNSSAPDDSIILENAIRVAINIHLCQD